MIGKVRASGRRRSLEVLRSRYYDVFRVSIIQIPVGLVRKIEYQHKWKDFRDKVVR